MAVSIISAQIYSMNGGKEVASQIEYSTGDKVRAVESVGNIIRCEALVKGVWVSTCKPYVVIASKKRNAERVKEAAKNFIETL